MNHFIRKYDEIFFMSMIDNRNGTITCPKCNQTYMIGSIFQDIIDKMATGKNCDVCLGKIWDWGNSIR